MEKEIKEYFLPGKSSKVYKNAKKVSIGIVCIFKEISQHSNDKWRRGVFK